MVTRNTAAVLPLIALLFGLAASGLSFLAYTNRIKAKDITIDSHGVWPVCMYPSTPAFAVGILAALLILIHQILITTATACFCCGRSKFPCNLCGVIAFILFLLSWASFVVTFVGLIITAEINNKSYLRSNVNPIIGQKKEDCLLGKETLFFSTALWCIINIIFSLASYATYRCGIRRHKAHNLPA